MRVGRRDTLISFQRAATTRDDYGEETSAWSALGQEWAAIIWGRGEERRQAAAEQGVQTATFQVLDNEMTRSVGVKDRIYSDAAWDILGIATPNRGEIEFTAARAR